MSWHHKQKMELQWHAIKAPFRCTAAKIACLQTVNWTLPAPQNHIFVHRGATCCQRRCMWQDGCDQPVSEEAVQSLYAVWMWGQGLLPNFLSFSSMGVPNQSTLNSCLLFPSKPFQFTEDCSQNRNGKQEQEKNQNFVLSGSYTQRCEFWDTFM